MVFLTEERELRCGRWREGTWVEFQQREEDEARDGASEVRKGGQCYGPQMCEPCLVIRRVSRSSASAGISLGDAFTFCLVQQLDKFDVEGETIRVETGAEKKDWKKGLRCFTRWGEVFVETFLTEVTVLFKNK